MQILTHRVIDKSSGRCVGGYLDVRFTVGIRGIGASRGPLGRWRTTAVCVCRKKDPLDGLPCCVLLRDMDIQVCGVDLSSRNECHAAGQGCGGLNEEGSARPRLHFH